jgi:hypothetical protein
MGILDKIYSFFFEGEEKHVDSDFDLNELKENVRKYRETHQKQTIKDKEKHVDSNFDLNELKENLRKYRAAHPEQTIKDDDKHKDLNFDLRESKEGEENSETIKANYTVNMNLLIYKKISDYQNIKCCASCWFCFISPVRTHRCVKHNFKNKLNGCCDNYEYSKKQVQDT